MMRLTRRDWAAPACNADTTLGACPRQYSSRPAQAWMATRNHAGWHPSVAGEETMPLDLFHASLGVAFLAVWALIGDIIVRNP